MTMRVLGFALAVGLIAFGVLEPPLGASPAPLDDPARPALEMLKASQPAAAIPLLERLVATEPSVGRYQYYLGFALIGVYRPAEAEAHLRQAVAADPGQAEWLHALAKALLEQGKNVEAGATLERAIAITPRPEYQIARAITAVNAGKLGVARQSLDAALRRSPHDPDGLYWLGKLLADDGENVQALELLDRCLKVDPNHLEARFRRGLVASRLGQLEPARHEFEAVLEVVPGHVGALYNLGQVLARLGHKEAARARLEEFRHASLLEDQIQFLRESVALNATSVDKRVMLARLQLESGAAGDALETLQAAVALQPHKGEVYRQLATTLRRLGRGADADRAERFADDLDLRDRAAP